MTGLNPSEHEIQAAFIQYCNWMAIQDERYQLVAAVPNGGQRHPAVAQKLKKEGVKPGYPDVIIDVPNAHFHGLRIEFKRPKGQQTAAQKEWQKRLTKQGFLYTVCYSTTEAIQVLTEYLKDGFTTTISD